MMLLRTLVLERDGQDAPVNGALLCGFSIGQIGSNFLVYSLDEEVEPGSSRVYIAALRKKPERYFLGAVESKEDLQIAMGVFKQILMLAASGAKADGVSDGQVPYHFVDLKGCSLPPARPEDHHSVIIKKALVMKVISLGMSAPSLPAIESAALIVPSIRFSSQMSSLPRVSSPPEPVQLPVHEPLVEEPQNVSVESPLVTLQVAPVAPVAPSVLEVPPPVLPAPAEQNALFEVDSTLSSLARVAQELSQQKLAITEREGSLEQWQARLQQQQSHLDERARELEQRATQLHDQSMAFNQKAEAMKGMVSQVSTLRQSLRSMLQDLDLALES
ncbi:hypothetical protein [Pseudomonas poae]|uniref:Uncharacterized protein n=1 Tax=Pseudomonas poae TaxID=200451 RepID=A0A2S9EEU2_9PSED|nr:hypothetical protein [Pseudomonas poae]PRA27195.1 hypothetical protein CQZ97_17890 [Pseudomonas poae]PRC13599.1 hypothetical protein CQZ99_20805 [Pseudomonas poae]